MSKTINNKEYRLRLFKEKIDTNLLYGSIEITLLNKLFKNKLINEKIYKQAKENIIKEYKLDKIEIWFYKDKSV